VLPVTFGASVIGLENKKALRIESPGRDIESAASVLLALLSQPSKVPARDESTPGVIPNSGRNNKIALQMKCGASKIKLPRCHQLRKPEIFHRLVADHGTGASCW
jgi:hypothetical protein